MFLTNSGSESTDLALRLATTYHSSLNSSENTTVNREHYVISFSNSYHGHTTASISISPYKLRKLYKDKSGMVNLVGNVRWTYPPNMYRHPFDSSFSVDNGDTEKIRDLYIDEFKKVLDSIPIDGDITLFYEVGMSVGGVLLPPAGYLSTICKLVRSRGGIIVFDEVQTCVGRLGGCNDNGLWGHQTPLGGGFNIGDPTSDRPKPDILTAGKGIGNGIPLSACLASREICENKVFNSIEYFNTFGGSPLSSAAGLAVIDILNEENLISKASTCGEKMKKRLGEIKARCPSIGDIRGSGLFLGIEFINPNEIKEKSPWDIGTSMIVSRMKDNFRILCTIDGEHDNVVVFKPPLTFGFEEEGQYFCYALEECVKFVADDFTNNFEKFEGMKLTPT